MKEEILIKESGEPLVDVAVACPDLIIDLWKKRIKKEKSVYLRKTVAEKLNQAKKYLPSHMTFLIGDAWRPESVQKNILKRFERKFKREHPEWSTDRVEQEVKQYAAPSNGKQVSGHMTGGAVDLRLCYLDGRRVPLRSMKLSYQENAEPYQPKLPNYIVKNRKIMFSALRKAGLAMNPNEYWHWSYGDLRWAKRSGKTRAIYNVIRNSNNKERV